jgi:Na+/phosphate symporter
MIVDLDKVKARVNSMSRDELSEYGVMISTSELNRESKIAIYQEIDSRIDYLEKIGDSMVIDSEIESFSDFEL